MKEMLRKILLGLLLILVIGVGVLYSILPPLNIPLAIFRGGIDVDSDTLSKRIDIPDGFRFTLFATGMRGVRFMHVTPAGDVLLSISNPLVVSASRI